MKSTFLIPIVALPVTLANLLGVDIVAPAQWPNISASVKIESASPGPELLTPQASGMIDEATGEPNKLWCLNDNGEWSQFCNGKKTVQVLGHINFAEPTKDPRPVKLTAGTYHASCKMTVVGEGDLGNVIWDVSRAEEGLLGYNLELGFKSDAMKSECDDYWENDEGFRHKYGSADEV